MVVYMFPGQGSQVRGMGKDVFDVFPTEVEQANGILGYNIRVLCLEDPHHQLDLTQYTQPALYVVSALSYLMARREQESSPSYLLGHSLGEYVALFAAGCFDFATGLRLVQKRSALMAGTSVRGGMLAIIGLALPEIQQIVTEYQLEGVDIANHNAPDQVVISGTQSGIEAAESVFSEHARACIPLNVSAPFHSRYMSQAQEAFEAYLKQFTLHAPRLRIMANYTAQPYQDDELSSNLVNQITGTVRWAESIMWLLEHGQDSFQQIGPGKVLTNLVARIKQHYINTRS